MASDLVETKLHLPRLRAGLVARPQLSDRLSRAVQSRLTLVSAPAGFGKTTLLAGWLTAGPAEERAVAWLSLDQSDSRSATFWTGVVSALQTAVPGVGASVLPLLQSATPPIESILVTVLNELSAVPYDLFLVLDDYHLADTPEIQSGMTFLLDHLPPQVHLVISTRADPALPLARLRARGELVEVRAADLRFSLDEAAAYLNDVAGLGLTAPDIASLEERTEGWVAALQLAALSLEGRDDATRFIAGFAGDDRYIVDYLVEEVLARQPDEVRDFLLRTSILDRLSGPLCDAVAGGHGGKAMLEALDRANLFLVPLDDSRRWYRYHHLFADVLQTHLLDERPAAEVAALHLRAGDWYDRAGELVPAVRHALAGGDVERAADLVELAVPGLRRARQEATIRGWLDVIPDEVVRVRPVLAVGFVGALMAGGEFDGVEARLSDVERLLDDAGGEGRSESAAEVVVVDQQELARLPGAIQLYRAALALVEGDPQGTVRHAQTAVDRAVEDDDLTRAAASALSGLASWGSGDLDAAHRAYTVAVERLLRAGHVSDVLGCSITLADIRITQGRLRDAQRTYEEALRLGAGEPGTLRGTADMHVGLSQLACERGDLDSARGHLLLGQELGEVAELPQNAYRRRVAMARVLQAEGDLPGAVAMLDEAHQVYLGDFSPNVRPIPALRARLLVAQGALDEALAWARTEHLSAQDDLDYVLECAHLTLARILIARAAGRRSGAGPQDALRLLERLQAAAEAGGRTGSVIEILALRALAGHSDGDLPGALTSLDRALSLAEPEGHVRIFLDEGATMAALLTELTRRPRGSEYARHVLDAAGSARASGRRVVDEPATQSLVEPLSERELQVLRLLASDLDGPAIARELTVSLNTLRTHTKHIYAKLGVNSRRAAVRQAGRLDLLPRRGGR